MARLGVLSDTHLPKPAGLPQVLLRSFEGVDAILHGGDVTRLDCLAPLSALAPVYVVTGNNDPPEMATRYGWRRALRWRGWRIGLVHGDVGKSRRTAWNARNAFIEPPPRWEEIAPSDPPPTLPPLTHRVAVPQGRPSGADLTAPADAPFDCIIFGHSHVPHCAVLDRILTVNPGSPTERRREPRASFVMMEGDETHLRIHFIYL